MPPTYEQLCNLLGFPVPRSYARFMQLIVADAGQEVWEPSDWGPFRDLKYSGPDAISISKPGDSVIFGWTGTDSEHWVFVIDDDAKDDRERPIAFWPIDGREGTGLIANTFPEFLEWLLAIGNERDEFDEEARTLFDKILCEEFAIRKMRSEDTICRSARKLRLKQPDVVPTSDNIGVCLPNGTVDRKYLSRIKWPLTGGDSTPVPELLDESEYRLKRGEPGTALVLARNYRFLWWYEDWKTGASILRRTNDVLVEAYRQLLRPMAAAETERQTKWNLANVI